MYYSLTEQGLARVEQGLPEKRSDYFSVLGAIADLEEVNPLKAHTELEIRNVREKPKAPIILMLRSLVRHGLIEEVTPGDERFDWIETKEQKHYKVGDIKVTIKYERPGVHLVNVDPPEGRRITEEEGKRITQLIEKETGSH